MGNENNIIDFKAGTRPAATCGSVALSWADEKEIKRQQQRTEKKKRMHAAKIEERILDAEIKQNNLQQRQKEQEQEIKNVKKEIGFLKAIIEKADLTSTKDYFLTRAKNKAEMTSRNKTTGENFKKASATLSVLSACTSVIGIILGQLSFIGDCLQNNDIIGVISSTIIMLTSTILFLVFAVKVNKILAALPAYLAEFYEAENKQSDITLKITLLALGGNFILSVFTNYLFWNTTNLVFIAKITFSFIFDVAAISLSLLSDNFIRLNYKKIIKNLYENKLKDITEVEEKTREITEEKAGEKDIKKNENLKNIKLSENTTNTDLQTVEENKKKDKKAGRKNITKSKINRLQKAINELAKGAIITPKKTGFENDKNTYYELMPDMENVEQYTDASGKKKYRKI